MVQGGLSLRSERVCTRYMIGGPDWVRRVLGLGGYRVYNGDRMKATWVCTFSNRCDREIRALISSFVGICKVYKKYIRGRGWVFRVFLGMSPCLV